VSFGSSLPPLPKSRQRSAQQLPCQIFALLNTNFGLLLAAISDSLDAVSFDYYKDERLFSCSCVFLNTQMFQFPSLIIMSIATTRMHRSLADFGLGTPEMYDIFVFCLSIAGCNRLFCSTQESLARNSRMISYALSTHPSTEPNPV
jgi:hypothetical protein